MLLADQLTPPSDDRLKTRAIPRQTTDVLLARHRRLRMTNPYYAAETDGPRADLIPRAREMIGIETELFHRGVTPVGGYTVITPPTGG